jgi:shikimate dehydrogenase
VIRLALFGSPVRHSLSPRIHRQFANQGSVELEYEAIETPPGGVEEALRSLRGSGGVGCNVTLPLKREALRAAATAGDRALQAQAANTLLWRGGGWYADNTDGPGFITDLRACGIDPGARRVALIGAGGAAAGILATLLGTAPDAVELFNRTEKTATELADRHAGLGPVRARPLTALDGAGRFDLVIHATSAGHDGDQAPLAAEHFADGAACYDLNYGPAAAPLRDWCRDRDITYHDGLGMLVRQAAESFRLWTGYGPLAAPVVDTLRREVALEA